MDLVYAAAALEAWVPESFAGSIDKMAKDAYYNDLDVTSDGEVDDGARTPVPDARKN
jgi:hypothetical protein